MSLNKCLMVEYMAQEQVECRLAMTLFCILAVPMKCLFYEIKCFREIDSISEISLKLLMCIWLVYILDAMCGCSGINKWGIVENKMFTRNNLLGKIPTIVSKLT